MDLCLEPVPREDFEALHRLRMTAMRDSLERLGRFDPERSRARLAGGFEPPQMWHIGGDGERIGFLTLVPEGAAPRLKHFLSACDSQGQGGGAWAMAWVQRRGQNVMLNALKGSEAKRFYQRCGSMPADEDEFDIQYRWSAAQ